MPDILHVALPLPLPRLFDYLAPTTMPVEPGCRVKVPFGTGHRIGIVVSRDGSSMVALSKLKPVADVIDTRPLLDPALMAMLAWAGDYWLGAPGEVLFNALPAALRGDRDLPGIDKQGWRATPAGIAALAAGKRRGRSRALLDVLGGQTLATEQLNARLDVWRDAARRLLDANLIERADMLSEAPHPQMGPELVEAQRQAVDAIQAAGDRFHVHLIDGVTGSGKTEVYLQLMQSALANKRQVLMLVPEIGLTPQMVERLSRRLGMPVDVLHSGLPAVERARRWLRAREGVAHVILGTRSAIFTPLPHAGLIIVDEEHDASYKQQDGFRYHARDLAVWRARARDIPVILGSATPSLETLANVAADRYACVRLPRRVKARSQPEVSVIDMRAQRLSDSGLAPQVEQTIATTIDRGEQVLVFRNRRGYAPVLMCHQCGWHAHCERCDRPMTLHATRRRMICHHCDREAPVPTVCPDCGHADLQPQGHGTERMEQALQQRFPDTPTWRIDSESTRRRGALAHIMDTLQQGGPAIIVGTQILTKGHDLANLTLVVITGIDGGLLSTDFRAPEHLVQLVIQVAGRAGRAAKPGRVLLQTHYPDHPFLQHLLHQGYAASASQLLAERRALSLPPISSQILLRAETADQQRLRQFLQAARKTLPPSPQVRVLGPMPAPMPLRAGRHRGQILLEADQRPPLHRLAATWRLTLFSLPEAQRVRWSLDVDPMDLG